MPRTKRNPTAVRGIPVERTNLTPAERALLADPDVLTEDDADFITIQRRAARGLKGTPIRKLLRKYGYKLEE